MPPVQALFFDIGDTLVFDDPPLRDRLARAGALDKARLSEAFCLGEEYALRRYVAGAPWNDPDSMREAVALIWTALGRDPFDDDGWPAFLTAFQAVSFTRFIHPEAVSLLRELKTRGFVVGAISDWEATLAGLLTELGIAPYLDALAVSEIVGVTKPDPRLFTEALRQAHVLPEHSLHVGDWYELDVAGAKAAGMSALLFDHEGRHPDADCPRVTTWTALTDYLLALPRPH